MTQLAGHELYHFYEEQFPGLHDKVRQKITERYSEEEFREIAGKYAEKLGRLNGMAENMDAEAYEAMVRRIESEIFADAFGNINYFRLGADRYTDAARETVNETLGTETAAATERRTGPPTEFSGGEWEGAEADYRILDLIRKVERGEAKDNESVDFGAVDDKTAEQIQKLTGINVRGFRIVLEARQVRHTIKDHGKNGKTDHSMADPNDIAKLFYAMQTATEMRHGGRTDAYVEFRDGKNRSAQTVLYEKPIGNKSYYVVEAVPDTQQKKLFIVSAFIENPGYRKTSQSADALSPGTTPESAAVKSGNKVAETEPDVKSSFSASEDEDIPDNAAEYSRQRYREENREPQSAAEYSQMKQRALEREAEIRRLEKKGEASAEDRREAAWARREFAAPKEKANKQQATFAKKDLRNTIISEFGIPDGRKAEIGKLIDAYADRAYKDGKLTETDRQALFDKLYSEGVMTVPADDAFQAAREIIRGGRVYVPESVKHEFGDDWGIFRREAFAEGILLTNNKSDMGWDSWNAELAGEVFCGHTL